VIIETQSRMAVETGLRVLLVEDDRVTREVLAMALEGMGHEVHTEPDGRWVDRAVEAFQPDVALIGMRVGHGLLRTAKRLRAHDDIPMLFLTAASGVEDVIEAFEVGGDDYVVIPFVMAELQDRMRAVLRRAGRGAPSVLRIGDLCIDVDAHAASRAGNAIELTHREFSLLLLLCRHPGVVLSKARVLTDVWGSSEHYDVNVVEVHMSALRRKLEEHGPRLIHTVRGVGYVLRAS
jgi:two-component system, OmpR family, response regulator